MFGELLLKFCQQSMSRDTSCLLSHSLGVVKEAAYNVTQIYHWTQYDEIYHHYT